MKVYEYDISTQMFISFECDAGFEININEPGFIFLVWFKVSIQSCSQSVVMQISRWKSQPAILVNGFDDG